MKPDLPVKWLDSATEHAAALRQLHDELGQFRLVSSDLPLRANLSAAENIALGKAMQEGTMLMHELPAALQLLQQMGFDDIAGKRDDALNEQQRFAAKLARALLPGGRAVVIDRPVRMLPDLDYPRFMLPLLERMRPRCSCYMIIEYSWYAPLYEGLT